MASYFQKYQRCASYSPRCSKALTIRGELFEERQKKDLKELYKYYTQMLFIGVVGDTLINPLFVDFLDGLPV